MKKLCLKYGAIWLSLFALFFFSFIVGKQSNAADVLSIEQATGTHTGYPDGRAQTFTAVDNNLSKIDLYFYSQNGNSYCSINICEVSSANSFECLGDTITQTSAEKESWSNPDWWTYIFDEPVDTTIGNFYKIWQTGCGFTVYNGANQGGNPYAGGTAFTSGGDIKTDWDLMFKLYYSNTYVPPAQGIIYAFGWPSLWSNPSVFQPNSGVKQFPIFWNACNNYDILDHASVVPVFNGSGYHPGTAVIDPKASVIGPQECKGNFIYYDTFDTTTSGYVDFNLLFYDISGNVIATTTSNRVSYTTATSSGTFISNIDSDPLNIDLGNLPEYGQTESTTTLSFMYNFIGENAASTTVYLWDYQNNTSTGFIYNGPFISTSTSWASIEIPTPDINTYKTYKFIAVRPGYSNLVSSLFGVNWNFTPIPLKPECKPPNYDITRICDGIATGPLPDYILGDLLCGVKYGLVAAGQFMFQPNCDSLDYITDNYNLFKGSFPFNTYFDLTDSINTAIDTATTSTSTLNAFSIPFIRKTSTSSEYYMMPVMNATSVSQSIGNTNYNTYKTTLGYIWWLLGALIIYITIRKV